MWHYWQGIGCPIWRLVFPHQPNHQSKKSQRPYSSVPVAGGVSAVKEEKPIFAMVVVVVLIIWAIYAGFVLGGVYLILLGIERIDWPFGKLVGLILLGIALVLFFAITIQ